MITPRFTYGLSDDAKMIRQKVFVEEEGFREEFEEQDKTAWHLVLYRDGMPIATGRILKEDPETYRIGRVAVLKEYRGHQVGRYLMRFLETKITELGGRRAILDAQADKKGFYDKCGYGVSGDGEIFYEEGYPHIRMEKSLGKDKSVKRR
jgi:predicted GNAT family N-acyltransferase